MNGYTDMKNEEVTRYNCESTSCKAVDPTPTVSYLGEKAMSTLLDINDKLRSIERFIDYGDASLGEWGTPSSPDNLMHNLNCVCNALNDIDHRLGLLQEKL